MGADIRTGIADFLRQEENWRAAKADEWPEDDRNRRSVMALRAAADHVLGLPETDPRLVKIDALEWDFPGFFMPGEEGRRVASRCGFDRLEPDLDAWFTRFFDACMKDVTDFYEICREDAEHWLATR